MKKRTPFRWAVRSIPMREKARSAVLRTSPQKKVETETRISPEVWRSASSMARLTASASMSFLSFARCIVFPSLKRKTTHHGDTEDTEKNHFR